MPRVLDILLGRRKAISEKKGRTKTTTQHFVGQGLFRKPFVYYEREKVSQRELSLLEEAINNNISVERPYSYSVIGQDKMYYYSSGIKISRIMPFLSNKIKLNIANQLLDIFSKLHELGISHNHPHIRNITIDGKGKITLIDFKNARKDPINWEDIAEPIYCFEKDYAYLYKTFLDLGFDINQSKKFLKILISRYSKLDNSLIDSFYDSLIVSLRNHFNRTTNTYLKGTKI